MIFIYFVIILLILFDVSYFIRTCITVLTYAVLSLFSKEQFTHKIDLHGICLTTDLDTQWHMNNSRYLRECDFGRMKLFLVTKLWKSTVKCGGSLVNAGNNIRYRKSIELFDRYIIRSKVIYWDEKAFYIEQYFMRVRDNFVCAVNIVKMSVIGTTPADIVKTLEGRDIPPPSPPHELLKLLESWQLSSENLRKNF